MFSMSKNANMQSVIQTATTKITGDISALSEKRENALSTFRATANELGTINDSLRERQNNLLELANFIQTQTDATGKMIADNEAVRSRILEIIGD